MIIRRTGRQGPLGRGPSQSIEAQTRVGLVQRELQPVLILLGAHPLPVPLDNEVAPRAQRGEAPRVDARPRGVAFDAVPGRLGEGDDDDEP